MMAKNNQWMERIKDWIIIALIILVIVSPILLFLSVLLKNAVGIIVSIVLISVLYIIIMIILNEL